MEASILQRNVGPAQASLLLVQAFGVQKREREGDMESMGERESVR